MTLARDCLVWEHQNKEGGNLPKPTEAVHTVKTRIVMIWWGFPPVDLLYCIVRTQSQPSARLDVG